LNRLTHVTIGFVTGLYLSRGVDALLYAIWSAVGAYAPDLRHPPGRRGKLTHSLITPILIFLLNTSIASLYADMVGYSVAVEIYFKSSLAFTLGWITHILADALSAGGVYILWPVSRVNVRLTKLKSSSLLLNFAGILIAFALLYAWIISSGVSDYLENIVEELTRITFS